MTRALALAFGLLMVAAGAAQADGAALVASGVAVAAVVVGVLVRAAATLAVLATVAALALSTPSAVAAALAGLAAVAYLVLRHSRGVEPALTLPTVAGAVGFSAVAVLGAIVPLGLPWVPLVAPLAVVVGYAMVTSQYAR